MIIISFNLLRNRVFQPMSNLLDIYQLHCKLAAVLDELNDGMVIEKNKCKNHVRLYIYAKPVQGIHEEAMLEGAPSFPFCISPILIFFSLQTVLKIENSLK